MVMVTALKYIFVGKKKALGGVLLGGVLTSVHFVEV